jgi:uncharacterized protein GlcG (DUF336 family)
MPAPLDLATARRVLDAALAKADEIGQPMNVPLTVDGVVVGAVGVSAGSVDQDVTVAEAGVAAL